MPMKMLPNTSPETCGPEPSATAAGGVSRVSICTRTACQLPMTSASALVTHHPLDDALARLGNLACFASPVGAVVAQLAGLAGDLHGHELVDLVFAFAADRHRSILHHGSVEHRRETRTDLDRILARRKLAKTE